MKGKRITIEFAKAKFTERGYNLLASEYVNAQTKMKYICDKDHENQITWNNFKKGAGCFLCNGKVKPELDFIRQEFNKRGYVLKSDTYKNAKTKLKYLCDKGHECEVTWDSFRGKSSGCKKCSGLERHTIDFVRSKFKERNYTLLNTEYHTAHDYLYYICENGHECKITYNKFQQGNGCRTCGYVRGGIAQRKTQEEFEKEVYSAVENEYLVIGEYETIDTPILMKHNMCDFNFSVIPYNFTGQGTRCPKCSSSKGERMINDYLCHKNVKFEIQYTMQECRNVYPLKFDFALFEETTDSLVTLLEYDGIQHFEPVKWFGGEEGFEKTKQRDDIKNTYCKDNNIRLIRIPYWEYENIHSILEVELTQLGLINEIIKVRS